MHLAATLATILIGGIAAALPSAAAQEVLPFPPKPSGSIANETMQGSVYAPLPPERHLPEDAPNILIVLIDDAGPALPEVFGGEIATPALEQIVKEGIAYNRFHTTAMCSPTRAALLTGRNAHRVRQWADHRARQRLGRLFRHDPEEQCHGRRGLRHYGYATAAFGKWHNTPALETGPTGPFDFWPTGYGFEYFYGFLAGEASQWEPRLVRNTTIVHPTRTPEEGYHLSEDLADDAIGWLRRHQTFSPDRPFLMYWASGAMHAPHHVPKEWADRYQGRFDDGWDAYRERAFARAKEKGWIPEGAELTPRPDTLPAWDDIPEEQRPFQLRLMEVLAGFAEHVDTQVARLLDELDAQGIADNTLVLYIWGDNGSSAEGQDGTISELLAQNGIITEVSDHMATTEELGGLDVIGSPLTDNHHHAAWAWAGSAPYQGTKLVASHFGGTRNPLAVRWPARIAPDATPRPQFHHVNDVVPTLYEILGITPPHMVSGVPQDPFDGVAMTYSFADSAAEGRKTTQHFEVMGSRAIYHDGWMASVFGPRIPWAQGVVDLRSWNPADDVWELYNLEEDWSQAHDLAAEHPDKLAELKNLFLIEATRNKVLPVGGGLFVLAQRPDLRLAPPYDEWTFTGALSDLPEFSAPRLGNTPNVVAIDFEVPAAASGVLYALGSFAGGLAAYLDDGRLCYEYNLFIIDRTTTCSEAELEPGRRTIEVTTVYEGTPAARGPLAVTLAVDGATVAEARVPVSAPLLFTANDGFDVGRDLGSPVGLAYRDRAPFAFTGEIHEVHVRYLR